MLLRGTTQLRAFVPMSQPVIRGLAAVALWLLVAASAAAQGRPPSQARLLSAEFLGCSGDPGHSGHEASARRLTNDRTVTFLVSSVSSCGLRGRNLEAVWGGDRLDLRFEMYSPDGSIVMCLCEYWAKFTFDEPAMYLREVTVNGRDPVLAGEWPRAR